MTESVSQVFLPKSGLWLSFNFSQEGFSSDWRQRSRVFQSCPSIGDGFMNYQEVQVKKHDGGTGFVQKGIYCGRNQEEAGL